MPILRKTDLNRTPPISVFDGTGAEEMKREIPAVDYEPVSHDSMRSGVIAQFGAELLRILPKLFTIRVISRNESVRRKRNTLSSMSLTPDQSPSRPDSPNHHNSEISETVSAEKRRDTFEETVQRLQDSLEAITQLEADLRKGVSALPTIRELHVRLDRAHQALASVPLLPLFRDLLLMRDRFARWKEERGSDLAESLVAELDEILARQGVERLPFIAGKFNPACQEAVETHPTERLEDSGLALHLIRDGFTFDQKILRTQQVAVGVWRENTNPPTC